MFLPSCFIYGWSEITGISHTRWKREYREIFKELRVSLLFIKNIGKLFLLVIISKKKSVETQKLKEGISELTVRVEQARVKGFSVKSLVLIGKIWGTGALGGFREK